MNPKNILITGSNRGIGFEIARQSGKAGCHVIISGRDGGGLEKAHNELRKEKINAEMLVMDVSSPESITNAATAFSAMNLRLDVLMNNAGISLKGDESLLRSEETIFHETLITNSYGPLRIVRGFLRFMNSPGRIVMMSSGGGSMSDEVGGWSPAYCVSKTLLNAITRHLAYELKGKKISVNAVCPGWVRTEMGGLSAPRSVAQGAETPVWLATEAPQSLTGKNFRDKREIPW